MKLAVVVVGIFMSYVSLIGFLLRFCGMYISSFNIVSVLAVVCAAIYALRLKRKIRGPQISFDAGGSATLAGIFIASLFFYIYPALPSFVSPCTPGFDCTHHIEYSQSIYEDKVPKAPVDVWMYYPFGLHTNIAFLADTMTSSPPSDRNVFYLFMALITALSAVITCGILMDQGVCKAYALLLAAFLMLSIYPASALIGYGFWAQIYGTFYILLFFWALEDYMTKNGRKIIALLSLFSVASLLGYQVLVAMPIVVGMIFAVLAAPQMSLKRRAFHLAFFLTVFLLVFSMTT